jgi:hypothetical protein
VSAHVINFGLLGLGNTCEIDDIKVLNVAMLKKLVDC